MNDVSISGTWSKDFDNFGFVVYWESNSNYFGNISFSSKNGKLIIDSENMSRDFVKEVLNHLVDKAKFSHET